MISAEQVIEDALEDATVEQSELLRSPECREEWQEVVVAVMEEVSSELEVLEAEAATIYEEFKDFSDNPLSKGMKDRLLYLRHLKQRLEAKIAEGCRIIYLDSEEAKENEMVHFLRSAILDHMREKKGKGDSSDESLWGAAFGYIK